MNIHEFIIERRTEHRERYNRQTAAEVLLKIVPPEIPDWTSVFRSGGYYMVNPRLAEWSGHWREMHIWCVEHFGKDSYAWNGNNFWFETEKDAIMFTLRWA
jgi:hypothetical protein